jgi:hypothetical protein
MEEHTHDASQKEYACWCREINEEMAKLGNMFKGLGPSDQVKEHFRNSRVEFLKGLRRMIDDKIERAQSQGQAHGTSVPVE